MDDPTKIIEHLCENFDSWIIQNDITKALPLLGDIQKRNSSDNIFSGIDVLFVQHHLGPFVARINAMLETGMDRSRCWVIDIPYSTNQKVVSYLTDDDFQPNQMSEIFNHPLKDYCTVQERRVADVMESFAKRPDPQPMLVIDDGAYFLRYLKQCDDSNSEFSDAFRNASVVEQTTRGHRYVVDHALDIIKKYEISVVSIAKCKTKTYFEAPFIGAAVARALRNTLTEEDILRATRIGVIGYGAVGQAVVRELLRMDPKAIIDVVDIQYEARQKVSSLARPRCRGTAQLETDASYDIILGCTGYNSFHLGQRYLLSNGAILASGSSAAIEFNRTKFIELADQSEDDDIEVVNREKTIEAGIHSPITLRHDGGKTFTFLNAGFPINFDGRLECLPAQIIQATHALMYQASVQTLSQPNGGVNAIDPRDDDWTFRRSLSYLSKM